jgi:hypothetical protein
LIASTPHPGRSFTTCFHSGCAISSIRGIDITRLAEGCGGSKWTRFTGGAILGFARDVRDCADRSARHCDRRSGAP